jgi:hypothetical protein
MYILKIISKKGADDKTADKMVLYTEKLGRTREYYLVFGGVVFSQTTSGS